MAPQAVHDRVPSPPPDSPQTVRRVAPGPLLERAQLLRARLQAVPASPGVYLFRDARAQVAYVGKSANLRDRLRSYFVAPASHPPRIRRLVESAFDFEVVATGSEQEALILENTLIKRYRPRFNVRLRDDKNYLYFRLPKPLTAGSSKPPESLAERLAAYPRPSFTRRLGTDGAAYFGPYTDATTVRRSIRELRTAVPFRGCSDAIFRRGRVCLDFHIGICAGPCEGRISPEDYRELLDDAGSFLSGRTQAVRARLDASMQKASAELDFERAAALRDRARAVEKLTREQVTSPRLGSDLDVLGLALAGGQGAAAVLQVRQGRLQGMERHLLDGTGDLPDQEVLGSFLAQHYGSSPQVPRRVLVPEEPSGAGVLAAYLAERRGSPVELKVPQRGRLRRLLVRAQETAQAALAQSRVDRDFDQERTEGALADLARVIGLEEPPRRIECFDISNTMGEQSVASMVVFEEGRPKPSDYRTFSIRTVAGPDDFASMAEVVSRRFSHLVGEGGESSFGRRPDLVVVDGGEGQLAAAHRALLAAGMADLPHLGLAKRFEELYQVGEKQTIHLERGSAALFLLQRLRDEAHRFALTRHRARHQKVGLQSRLDEIGGLGPKRKKALLTRFGSVAAIRDASQEQLLEVPGVTRPVAAAIKELL